MVVWNPNHGSQVSCYNLSRRWMSMVRGSIFLKSSTPLTQWAKDGSSVDLHWAGMHSHAAFRRYLDRDFFIMCLWERTKMQKGILLGHFYICPYESRIMLPIKNPKIVNLGPDQNICSIVPVDLKHHQHKRKVLGYILCRPDGTLYHWVRNL